MPVDHFLNQPYDKKYIYYFPLFFFFFPKEKKNEYAVDHVLELLFWDI